MGLLPNHAYTPRLEESMTRLATWMPFARAVGELAFFTGVPVAEATVRRVAEAAGAAYVVVQEAVVEALERGVLPAPAGPAVQFMRVDGAFIQLVNSEWKEVKTLAVGVVQPPVVEQGKTVVHTRELSYFSRSSPAEPFQRQALAETHRRGVTAAGVVCAVTDGSAWIQGFIDYHRPDAVRMLDQPHALAYIAMIGKALHGEDTAAFQPWFADYQRQLNTAPPEVVMAALRCALGLGPDAVAPDHLAYLEKRCAHLRYAEFLAQGYPIGDGSVESANKLVVEARLKGTGMRWAEGHVDSLLALRNIACNDRWPEGWAQIAAEQQAAIRRRRVARRAAQQTAPCGPVLRRSDEPDPPPPRPPGPPGAVNRGTPAARALTGVDLARQRSSRPAATHPWRRPFSRRAQS